MIVRWRLLACGAVALGCAKEPLLRAPSHGSSHAGSAQDDRPPFLRQFPRYTHGRSGALFPGGHACLFWLQQYGIPHRPIDAKPGMQTPVSIEGPISGVWFTSGGKPSLVCDCRLALALNWVAQHLRDLGVTEVRHLGAYSYRTTRRGRLSLHALGLAIDVHELRFGERRLAVKRDFSVGADDCDDGAPRLNQVDCRLRHLDVFGEQLTPRYNADHRDHFHWALAPL